MLQKFKNLLSLYKIIKTRGNRKLINHSRQQLKDFILCNNDLNRKSFFQALFYWFNMLKGLDVLVWRLETFGFLYSPILNDEEKSLAIRSLILSVMPIEDRPGSEHIRGFLIPRVFKTSDILFIAPFSK